MGIGRNQEVWNMQIIVNPMWILQQKLKALSKKLSVWSREVIGDEYLKVTEWETEVQRLEEQELVKNDARTRQELNKAHAGYVKLLSMQESILRQKAQLKWFEAGDYNNKYFHSVIKEKRRRMQLNKIKNHRGN